MKQKVNLLPNLRCVLDGCYTPGDVTDGAVSLSANDFQAFQLLCKSVKYKPEGGIEEVGGGGAVVKVMDLAAAIKACPQDLAVEVPITVPE